MTVDWAFVGNCVQICFSSPLMTKHLGINPESRPCLHPSQKKSPLQQAWERHFASQVIVYLDRQDKTTLPTTFSIDRAVTNAVASDCWLCPRGKSRKDTSQLEEKVDKQ